eukprot:FR736943.1.p2 GENE.FR736943.1~~FR736943.1.p2  ORF type:complete len:110 (-),score=31.11 FR736943.1:817-1146(-)
MTTNHPLSPPAGFGENIKNNKGDPKEFSQEEKRGQRSGNPNKFGSSSSPIGPPGLFHFFFFRLCLLVGNGEGINNSTQRNSNGQDYAKAGNYTSLKGPKRGVPPRWGPL